MHSNRWIVLAALLTTTSAFGQESFKVEVLKEAPPAALADAIKGTLNAQGYRVVDDQGRPYADIWIRKAVPASAKPAGSKGAIQFPILQEGELVGALRFSAEGRDYRDQSIAEGVYTLRYGLQPVNGDHLGVSTYRDYVLLLPASKDKALDAPAQKKLHAESSESAGSSHPAVLMLLNAPESASKTEPSVVRDEAKNTWAAVVPINLAVKGSSEPATLQVQIVVIGAAMN
ncbi:hypothetical protein [Singulisphaera sp. PoT]|uniref:hypothetical protein n=1 Tax=Singulisphaera sp. PoT TaxID=3411797 RepID=UPI003BF5E7F2